MNDIKIPSIEFVRLKKGMTDKKLNHYMGNADDYSFLVYLRYKYDFEKEWTYATECASWWSDGNTVNWLDDWYEGQQNVEYLAITKIGKNRKLVNKADSFEWIPFTFDEEGVLNCELPDIGERILVSDTEAMYDDESIWIDSWDSPDCGIYELESGEDLKGLAWMPLPNPYKGNQHETNC
jgi:hypothetical protein